MMQRLLPYGLQNYLPDKIAKPIIDLCSLFKQICSATLMEDDMLKAQIKVVDILCELELIYPPALFDIMVHLVIHLLIEALEGGPIHNGGILFLTRHAEEFPTGLIRQRHVDNDQDPEVSTTSELFALANGPSWTPISVNSCVVDGVRYVVHSRDERRTTQNSGICSPGPDGEMYYGQLQEIIRFKYLLFKVALFRVKWFDTSNKGRKVNKLVLRNNMTQINCSREAFKDDQYILVTQVKQVFYLEDKTKPHWKVVEHVNHKKFSDGGVIVSLPYDLADSDVEDLINVVDDGVEKMSSADVARSHGGDGGGDDRPPSHVVPTGCGGCFANKENESNWGQGSGQAEYPRQDPEPFTKGDRGS
ncbi:putative receptor-like protein kinase [Tanacetum coccineum]|uniref:Receptor-like protein kinase n=1 Tax=Tanacetum coccineum TaxID=301880 RepID=A0ABQ4YV91_9ASTR